MLPELRLPSSESEAIAASNSAAVVSADVRFEPDETLVSKFIINKRFLMDKIKSNK